MTGCFKNSLIIGCAVVVNELDQLLPGHQARCKIIDAGLHLRPEQLKTALQEAIEAADGKYETIALGFGMCSNAVIGLQARVSTLVVPRVDDCIAMILGSQSRYREELRRVPGTYFLSRGYIDAGVSLVDEFNTMSERYGKERAQKLMKKMLGHYTRLAYINLGNGDQKAYQDFSRRAARMLELGYEEISGATGLLHALIRGSWDESFIFAEAGRALRLEDFRI